MKVKIINFVDKDIFENTVEDFCEHHIILDIKYAIARKNNSNDIVHSAMILYK